MFDRLLDSVLYVCNCSIQGFLAANRDMLFDKMTILKGFEYYLCEPSRILELYFSSRVFNSLDLLKVCDTWAGLC